MKSNYIVYALFLLAGLIQSCSTTENPTPKVDELKAVIANPDQTTSPFTEVTLDGSQSTGPDGLAYEWIYQGSNNIALSSTTEAIVTFTPEKNGFYNFVLRVTVDGQFSETNAQVTVSGAVVLDANIFTSDQVDLVNIEPDPTLPDYIVNEDFTIPTGKSITSPGVTIAFANNTGIIINGSLITNNNVLTLQPSSTSWKGILVDGGILNNNGTLTTKKAGDTAFDGQLAATITLTNDGSLVSNQSIAIEENVADHGIVVTENASFTQTFGSTTISNVKYPIKTDMAHFSNAIFSALNLSGYDYIHLTTSGASTTVGSIDGQFNFNGRTFYMDGDFTAGSPISVNTSIIYMKEGAGIVGNNITINSSTFQGLNNVAWKGLASTATIAITSSDIIGAGSATHDTGSFTTSNPAAIFSTNIAILNGAAFTNSNGYGLYSTSLNPNNSITNSTFTNTTGTDVSMAYAIVGSLVRDGNSWSVPMPVEIRSGANSSAYAWKSLGAGFSYKAIDNILINTGFLTLDPGVSIKFATGKSLTITSKIVAEGTANEPITFDGVDGTPGSWAGILLQGQYVMDNCTITNGGGSTFIGAQAAANVVFGSSSSFATYPQTLYSFENNTVSNSLDYGATILLNKYNPVTPTASNTYTNNANGDIKLP